MNRGSINLLVVVLTLTILSHTIYAAPIDDVRIQLSQSFELVVNAEQHGADVSDLVAKLDQAADLLNVGDVKSLAKASSLINEVNLSVGSATEFGVRSTTLMYIWVFWKIVVLGIGGIIIYLYGSRVFWSLWLRLKRDWGVEVV